MKERERERVETEMIEVSEETEERGEKIPRTDTNTDPKCTQSRQKKGQMKSIFLSHSDEEAIVDFVKQQQENFDIVTRISKTSRGKKDFGKQLQLPGIYLSALSRSGSRLNITDMASSHRPSRAMLQPRTPRDRPG